MKRASQKSDASADGSATGEAADGLIYHGLKDGCCQVFASGSLVDQRLDICLGKYAAAGRNGVNGLVISGIFVQARGVCLNQGSHLVDKRSRPARADSVHALFGIPALEINDFGVLAAKFDRDICLRRIVPQSGRNGDDFLHEHDIEVFCQRKSAGTGDDRNGVSVAERAGCFLNQGDECFADICKMSLIIGEKQMILRVQNCDFDSCGTDVDSQFMQYIIFHKRTSIAEADRDY